MAKKPSAKAEFVLFDVIYEDGSQRSNRRVPATALCSSVSIFSADARKPRPASVSLTLRVVRSNSATPISSSSVRTSVDSVDCVK